MTQLLTYSPSPETEIRNVNSIDLVYCEGEPIVELGRKKALDDKYVYPEKGYNVGRCKMVKRNGGRCRNGVRHGWTVCSHHGAGHADRPGGRPMTTGRHSIYLPKRFLDRYEEHLNDPDYLAMRAEISLIDTRMGEVLEKLDTAASKDAWMLVRRASSLLKAKDDISTNDKMDLEGYLEDALEMTATEQEVWSEAMVLVEQRRKVADTERRRITEAQKSLTYEEAQAMMTFIVSAVKEEVKDEDTLIRILERMKVITR